MKTLIKRVIFPFALVLMLCLPFTMLSASAAYYTSTSLGIEADIVSNFNGYAIIGSLADSGSFNWVYSLLDSTGETVYTLPDNDFFTSLTDDGYFLLHYELLNSKLEKVLEFDPYAITHEGTPMPIGPDGTGQRFETVANGGVIAIVNDPVYFLDYSGEITGTYSPFIYLADGQVQIGPDGLINIFGYDMASSQLSCVVTDETGEVLVDLGSKYSTVGTFSEGLAFVRERTEDGDYISGYIDITGELQFTIDASILNNFSGGYAVVGVQSAGKTEYGIIDKSGKWVLKPQYDDLICRNGVYTVKKDGRFGYINVANRTIVPIEFNRLSNFVGDVGYGIKGGELFVITIDSYPSAEIPSYWAIEEVQAAIEAGLVPESLQGSYTEPISRGDVAQVFINLIEKVSGQSIDEFMEEQGVEIDNDAFTDTTDKAVLAASALEIVKGIGDNKFDPDSTLTRSQIAAVINRTANVFGVDTDGFEHTFTDLSGHWVDSELGWPVHAKIIEGIGNNRFDPNGKLTREQAIAITYRAMEALLSE